MHYFDYASSTPVNEEIIETYNKLVGRYYANPDALYPFALEVNSLIEQSRSLVAKLLGVRANEIIFTSGATESNNTAIKGVALARKEKGKHIITTCIEHSSVLNSCKWLQDYLGYEVTYLPVNQAGVISVEDLKNALRNDTILVSIMAINNETGAIQPIEEIKEVLKKYPDVYLHVDCVQAIGKMDIDFDGIDLASCSAHKLNGLKGSGFLMKKQHVSIVPLISGGKQEAGFRGGTPNSIGHILMGKTLRMALEHMDEHYQTVKQLHDYLYISLEEMDKIVMNSTFDSSPYIINFSCLTITSEVMMNALANRDFCVSAQSTCDDIRAYSHVISSMYSDRKRLAGTIRLSLDASKTKADIDELLTAIKETVQQYG